MLSANERRAEILATLNVRRYDTIDNLAFEFDVCRRTMINDIQILSIASPIYTVSGNGGGVYIMDGCYTGRKYMTNKQADLLRDLLTTLDADKVEILKSIIKSFTVPKKGERMYGK